MRGEVGDDGEVGEVGEVSEVSECGEVGEGGADCVDRICLSQYKFCLPRSLISLPCGESENERQKGVRGQ